MSLSPQFLDELRARTSLSTLIGRTVKVQKAGREHKACCPFHNEKTPSFTINDEKGFYHCFGCGAHGDAIRWMTDQRGLPFMDAVKELAAAAGMDVPQPDPRAAKRAEQARGLHDVMAAAQAFFEAQLDSIEGSEARSYLQRRGIDGKAAQIFGFGYAPDGRQRLKQALAEFGEPLLIAAGLLINPDGERDSYDRFRGRLMLPIRDIRGRVIAFGGRILGSGEPKYLNSPDTPLFDKGRTLYNIDRASPASRQTARAIVVEGYMDVVALDQAGFGESVAPLGTALTEHQIERLWKMVDVPILCFDGDAAGQKAADRAVVRALPILKPGRSLAFATMPAGMDPDDVIRSSGKEKFEAYLDLAKPLVDRLWQSERRDARVDTPEARAGLKERLLEKVATISDPLVQEQYRREITERFYEEFGWSRKQRETVAGFITQSSMEIEQLSMMGSKVNYAIYKAIVLGLSRWPEILYSHREQACALKYPSKLLRQWCDAMVALSVEKPQLDEAAIHDHLLSLELDPLPKRDLQRDLRFAFYSRNADPEKAKAQLAKAIEIILVDQDLAAHWDLYQAELRAQSSTDWMTEQQWERHLSLGSHRRRSDDQLREYLALQEDILEVAA